MNEAIEYFERHGMPLVTRCGLRSSDTDFAFIDARKTLGHMIEIYPTSEGLRGFYQMVRDASLGWDGRDPVRSL
jgi:hypothetical protein